MKRLSVAIISALIAGVNFNAIGREMYLACSMTGPEFTVNQYSFVFDAQKSSLFWIEGTQSFKVIRNTSTQLWASHAMKFQDFQYDATDFRLNRVTGAAEINYLRKPSKAKVVECNKERSWGCDDFLVLTEKSEHGSCKITDRKVE